MQLANVIALKAMAMYSFSLLASYNCLLALVQYLKANVAILYYFSVLITR